MLLLHRYFIPHPSFNNDFDVVNGHECDGCFVRSGFGNKDAWSVVCHQNKHNTIYVPCQNICIQLTLYVRVPGVNPSVLNIGCKHKHDSRCNH